MMNRQGGRKRRPARRQGQGGGKVPGGMPNQGMPGFGINPPQPGGMQFGGKPGGGGRKQPGGMPQMPEQSGFDYDAFNAWQDPTISDGGASAGQIQQGWGGFGGLESSGANSMLKTKMNNYLNQQSVGGDREQMINQMGYFNGGNPYTPQVARGTNQAMRARAQGNQQSGDYSAPGIYQHQSPGAYTPNPDGSTNMNFGGYIGSTTVGEDGSAQYTPYDINRPVGRRRSRSTGWSR